MRPQIQPLTAEAFIPFGDVIEASQQAKSFIINQGFTQRFHDLSNVDVLANGGHVSINIFRSQPLPLPIGIYLLERHPLSSQAFMPLSGRPYLVVVAPPGNLDESQVKVFLASPQQGVNYHAGTWHHFCLALYKESDFLVIDRVGDGPNCDEQMLEQTLFIEQGDI